MDILSSVKVKLTNQTYLSIWADLFSMILVYCLMFVAFYTKERVISKLMAIMS